MSEENQETQEGGMSGIKKTIAGLVATAVTAAGGYVATHIEAIFGGGEEETEQTQGVSVEVKSETNQNQSQVQAQKQEVQVTGPTINLTVPESKPAPAQTIIRETIKEVPAAPAKPVEEEDPW